MVIDQVGARLADTADSALMLTGVITWVWAISKVPTLYRFHVKPWWENRRWGLRFELVEPKVDPKIPFTFDE